MQSAQTLAKGYIPLPRTDFDDELWREARPRTRYEAWIDIRGALARGIPKGTLKRGEFQISERDLAKRWQWSRLRVRRFLDYLLRRESIRLIEAAHGDRAGIYAVVAMLEMENGEKTQHAHQVDHPREAETRAVPESPVQVQPVRDCRAEPPQTPYKEERTFKKKKPSVPVPVPIPDSVPVPETNKKRERAPKIFCAQQVREGPFTFSEEEYRELQAQWGKRLPDVLRAVIHYHARSPIQNPYLAVRRWQLPAATPETTQSPTGGNHEQRQRQQRRAPPYSNEQVRRIYEARDRAIERISRRSGH